MGDLCVRFARRLREQGLAVREGATAAEIRDFESKHGVQLPLDMMHFFCHTDGMRDDDLDLVNYIRFWPIGELRTLVDELPEYSRRVDNPQGAYVFADHLYWSLGFVVWLAPELVPAAPVFLVGDGPPVRVAESFAEFLKMYIEDAPGLLSVEPR